MKNLKIIITLALGSLPTLVYAGCVINTNNLYLNETAGTKKVESILRAKGYQVVSERNENSDFQLDVRYYGNDAHKTLHMMIWNEFSNVIINKSADYQTPFGIEGGIFERAQVVKLAKQMPACP